MTRQEKDRVLEILHKEVSFASEFSKLREENPYNSGWRKGVKDGLLRAIALVEKDYQTHS